MSSLSKEELVRYHRQIILPGFGMEGQLKIKNARVLVVGAGGLGCPLLLYLTGAGVGTIGIIDFDTVDLSNMHRQILFDSDDIGKNKAVVAKEKLTRKNPNVNFEIFDRVLDERNASEIISRFDVICDGSDNFLTRYLVNDTCVKQGKPLVYGSVLRYEGQLAVFNYHGGKQLRDLYPEAPEAEDVPSCSEAGVIGALPGIIGSMMAEKCIQVILGVEIPENELMLYHTFAEGINQIQY